MQKTVAMATKHEWTQHVSRLVVVLVSLDEARTLSEPKKALKLFITEGLRAVSSRLRILDSRTLWTVRSREEDGCSVRND